MKLTKPLIKAHEDALRLLEKDILTHDDKIFVINNWQEAAEHMNSKHGAFFTPFDLARELDQCCMFSHSIIDLCAGIGTLSFAASIDNLYTKTPTNITCVEINKDYVEVGKKILPEAKWITGSILDEELIKSLGTFKQSISNPPFGNVKTDGDIKLKYTGSDFELKAIEIASMLSEFGTFLLPQGSTPYTFSGQPNFTDLRGTDQMPSKVAKFIEQTKIEFQFNNGYDTSVHQKNWRGVSPTVEIIPFVFEPNQVINQIGQVALF